MLFTWSIRDAYQRKRRGLGSAWFCHSISFERPQKNAFAAGSALVQQRRIQTRGTRTSASRVLLLPLGTQGSWQSASGFLSPSPSQPRVALTETPSPAVNSVEKIFPPSLEKFATVSFVRPFSCSLFSFLSFDGGTNNPRFAAVVIQNSLEGTEVVRRFFFFNSLLLRRSVRMVSASLR